MDMTEENSLRYADETDKCFGLAGMAISLVVWDSEELLRSISLDAPIEEAMLLSPDFYLNLSPRTGAKAAWEQALKRFQLTAAMTVANVTCRQIVRQQRSLIDGPIDEAMRNFLADEGAELCQLEPDEVSRIYGQALTHCSRIFRHPGVASIARQLSDTLDRQRTLSATDVLEILAPLNRL